VYSWQKLLYSLNPNHIRLRQYRRFSKFLNVASDARLYGKTLINILTP